MVRSWIPLLALLPAAAAADLPAQYRRLIESALAPVEQHLAAHPDAGLKSLESRRGWRHFPSAILGAAVLRRVDLAVRIGDLLARESQTGYYQSRLDHHRDTYMWLEAYRLLEKDLGPDRRARWRKELERHIGELASECALREDFPWYNSPYIRTSPNHFSLWSSTLYLAGRLFANREWESLGARILHRFAAEEQTPDGYWGEHSRDGPTPGYDYLTLTAVALYYEHSRDPEALKALRRSTDFHQHFTWPDGTPVDVINDRNRRWGVSPWGNFGFTHFPDGRRFAEFLASFHREGDIGLETVGRLAQDLLYYHDGPAEPIPQDRPSYSYRLSVPAGIRKAGPWTVALSGIISTQEVTSQFYLDRQGNVSVFHEKLGLIITGANSKRQPELATFRERLAGGDLHHLPLSSKLTLADPRDRLSVAFRSFFADLYVEPRPDRRLAIRAVITGKGRPPEEAWLTLQLCLKPGEALETAAGRWTVGADALQLTPEQIGGRIRHAGWTLTVDPAARLSWPVYPFNPYANAPETNLAYAVGALSAPLQLKGGRGLRPGDQELAFTLEAP
jgi:hypothetical protein